MHRYTVEGGVSYFEQVVEILDNDINQISKEIDELYEAYDNSNSVREMKEIRRQIRSLALKGNAMIDDETALLKQIGGMR